MRCPVAVHAGAATGGTGFAPFTQSGAAPPVARCRIAGLSVGHVSPEAASGGAIGLVRDGDVIEFDIPNRTVNLAVSDSELASRRAEQDKKGWKPEAPRRRNVTTALKAYAAFATSAAKGAVRDLGDLG